MGLFDRLFSREKSAPQELIVPPPAFGRYSDNNKSKSQLEDWKLSKKYYEEKKYSDSVVHFFTYLRDERVDNVVFEPNDENARFHIYQGSKKISGTIDDNCLRAEVSIARLVKRSVPVMRKLLEKNFELYYSKFCMDEDHLKLKIYNNIVAAAPNKLYFALKELCIEADRLDDILVDDFASLEPEGIDHIVECTDAEKEIKYTFFRNWMDTTIAKVESLNADTYSGGITYLLLNLIFKIDYLLLPEGRFTEKLEEINSVFWNNLQETPAPERNKAMIDGLKELQQWEAEEIKKYFYNTKHTFALTKPTNFENVVTTITNTLNNIIWYQENDHNDIALEMLEYSLAYSQFMFSLPEAATQYFDLMMNVHYNDYYVAMGYPDLLYDASTNTFNTNRIKERLVGIGAESQDLFASVMMNPDEIVFDDLVSFSQSLLLQIINLDFTKKKEKNGQS